MQTSRVTIILHLRGVNKLLHVRSTFTDRFGFQIGMDDPHIMPVRGDELLKMVALKDIPYLVV